MNHRGKSIISRFSSQTSAKQQANKLNDSQQAMRTQQVKKQHVENEKHDEEEEEIQLLSSSSSTSSSSGLSSMNSSSQASKGKYETAASCQRKLAEFRCNDDDNQDQTYDEENDVGNCLKQLICSVADQADNEITEYTCFQLHEAVPAKTRSTTTTSGSSDEDAEVSISNRVRQLQNDSAYCSAKAYLVTRVAFNAPRRNIIRIVQDHISRINIRERPEFTVVLKPREALIEWRDQTAGGLSRGQQLVESVSFGQLSDCLIEESLVVWLLSGRIKGNSIDQSSELETTLDDIALALDEPVLDRRGNQIRANDEEIASPVELLVWLCSSDEEASRFKQAYEFLMGNNDYNNTSRHDELEVLLSRVAGNKRVPDCSQRERSGDKIGPMEDAGATDDDDDHHGQQANQHHDLRRLTGSRSLAAAADDSVSGNQLATSGRTGSKRNQQQQQQQMMFNSMGESKATVPATRIDQGKSQRLKGAKVDDQRACSTIITAKGSHEASASRAGKQADASETPVSSSTSSVSLMMPTKNDRKAKTKSLLGESSESMAGGGKQQQVKLQVRSKHGDEAGPDKQVKQTHQLKKSASGLDLSASSPSTGLASYYRNMASKVISNGQSKIKSFRDEMIKLNNRIPSSSTLSISTSSSISSSSSSSPTAKRTIAGQQSLAPDRSPIRQLGLQKQSSGRRLSSAGSERNLSFLNESFDNKSSNGRERAQANVVTPAGEQAGHQHGTAVGLSEATCLVGKMTDQVPTIKPRTSILKNKQQQNNGCDINNNINKADFSSRKQQTSNNNQQVVAGRKEREYYHSKCENAASSSLAKPKSILKPSKSVSNIAYEGRQAIPSYKSSYAMRDDGAWVEDDEDGAGHLGSSVSLSERRRGEEVSQLSSDQSEVKYLIGSNNERTQSGHRSQRRCSTSENRQPDAAQCDTKISNAVRGRLAIDSSLDKRRSTYSMANERLADNRIIGGEDTGNGRPLNGKNEPTFERIKQRASCYDISRLMSRNGLQNQLSKLRSGSTNSISGKPRQCRPALLLGEPKDQDEEEDELMASREIAEEAMSSSQRAMKGVKTTSSGADGTVRAKVSAAQLSSNRSSSSGTGNEPATSNWSSSIYSPGEVASAQGGRRQQQQSARLSLGIVKGTKSSDDASSTVRSTKKSEFDPRSLRKIPGSAAHHRQGIIEASSKSARQLQSDIQTIDGEVDDSASGELNGETANVSKREREQQVKDQAGSVAEDSSTEDEGPNQVSSSSLSKSGPFNLLRQSFNQKTLSSMLRFSGRASLRMKAASGNTATTETGNDSSSSASKKSAIAIAEANLLAAKQLKQQAQKLKEQQKREQQQALMDPAAMMLRAVQYNQQIQRQQQQQILFQQAAQQYAVAARGHMFDATSVQMQHQLLIQRQQQQQQQLAYMANLSSAHYLAQQMAVMSPAMVPMPAALPAQQLMYVQPPAPQQQQSSGIFQRSILKKSSKMEQSHQPKQVLYQSQVTANQQLVPMAVNHHSSFNIVYSGHSSTSSQIPQMQQVTYEEPANQPAPLSKQSSLGASMRKTVRSILINRSSLLSSSTSNDANHLDDGKQKLKSALKSASNNREIVLNSEGSDGDSSSSDSTMINSHKPQVVVLPKSALKKTSLDQQEISSTSSDSSCSSGRTLEYHDQMTEMKSTLARSSDYHRQSAKFNDAGRVNQCHTGKQSGQAGRKNVTFSAKLTSIL